MKKQSHKNKYGCLMAVVDETCKHVFEKLGKTLLTKDMLYNPPDDPTYGLETEFHCTLKYGFIPDLKKDDIAYILNGIKKPFFIKLLKLSTFKNSLFQVVKFDVEQSDTLKLLRSRCDEFKNEDTYKSYHPHMTLGYVNPEMYPYADQDLNIEVPISKFKYSGSNGKVLYINF